MATLRSNFADLFLADARPVLDSVIFDELEKYPDFMPKIFRMYSSDTWGDQTTTATGLPAAGQKLEGENVEFGSPIQGYDKTYTFSTYSTAVAFSEELVEDNRTNLVEDSYRSLGLSIYQTVQVTGFNVLNNGFTDTGPDGVSLLNTAHPLIGGGTYANRPSPEVALSVAGMREMETDMMRQVNDRSINVMLVPLKLIVPPELSFVAKELVKSQYKPLTGNNEINTLFGNYDVIVSPFLTSTTAWFAQSDVSQTQMRFYNRVAPSTRTWYDEKSGTVNTRIRCRFDVGYSNYPGVWGTTG